jgi:hypothetical protein
MGLYQRSGRAEIRNKFYGDSTMKRRKFLTGMAAGSLIASAGGRAAFASTDEKEHKAHYLFVQNGQAASLKAGVLRLKDVAPDTLYFTDRPDRIVGRITTKGYVDSWATGDDSFADDRAPRRRTGGREPSVQPCCTRDGGRPPEAAVQAEASNHPLLLPLREVVVRELGKGRARPGQVRTVESNASEPLMTCRKRRNGVETGRESLSRDQSGGNLSTAQAASGMEAARTWSRLLCGTWEPVTSMLREPRKGKPPERVSTDARYRDGATCSSEEGPVMGLERRGCPIRPERTRQPAMGGLR